MLGDSPVHKQNQINYKKQSRIGDDDDDDRGTLNVYSDVWTKALLHSPGMRQYTALRGVNGRFSRENILRIRARFYLFYICINNGTSHHRFNEKKKEWKQLSFSRYSIDTLFLNRLYFTRKKKERFSRKYGNTNHVLPFVKNSIVGKDPLLRTRYANLV